MHQSMLSNLGIWVTMPYASTMNHFSDHLKAQNTGERVRNLTEECKHVGWRRAVVHLTLLVGHGPSPLYSG